MSFFDLFKKKKTEDDIFEKLFVDPFKSKKKPNLEDFNESNMINNIGSAWSITERMTREEQDKWIDGKSDDQNLTLQQFFNNLNISIESVLNRPPINFDLLDSLSDEKRELFHIKKKINKNLSLEQFIKNENL